jgi:predicted nucleotidyltransferase
METSSKREGVVSEALQELKRKLQFHYGTRLEALYLYGSYARGTSREESDIDVLIALQGSVRPGEEISRLNAMVSEICLKYDLLISIYPVSAELLRTHLSPFFMSVRREAVEI